MIQNTFIEEFSRIEPVVSRLEGG